MTNKKKLHLALVTAALLLCLPVRGQFYSTGDDPGGQRWSTISSGHFRIIYPKGLDSLALEYGSLLEQYRIPVGTGIGFLPNEKYRKPLPVILHSYTADANGVVTWAPRRMELYTGPDGTFPETLEWKTNLAIHESRHVSQMQFARGKGFGIFNVLTGDLFTGAMSALYPGPAFLEGDAVVAETGLSNSGRGRDADFLEYFRASSAEAGFRNWYQWRWGSQKRYTPNHYATGYMLIAGMRYIYERPDFTKGYYDNIFNRKLPFPLFNLQYTIKETSGKNFADTWKEIAQVQQEIWEADEAARGPFTAPRRLTGYSRRFTEYLSPVAVGDELLAIRTGVTTSPRLVTVDPEGRVKKLRPFPLATVNLQYSRTMERLVWSESIPDLRWTMKSSSRIRTADISGQKVRTLTHEGRFYNPAPSVEDSRIAAAEYPYSGGTAITVIDGRDGRILERFPAPDSLQVVEPVWVGDSLFTSGISRNGFGIYAVQEGFRTVLEPQPAKIKQLRSDGNGILFVSDRTGVNELYRLTGGEVLRLSNNRIGASDFIAEGDSLTFAALTTDGRMLYRSETGPVKVDYSELSRYPVADRLSAQENAMDTGRREVTEFTRPEPYRKALHLLKFHSWIPAYVNYDKVSSLSFESLYSLATLGATAFFQNDLGTASGFIGYSAKSPAFKSPDQKQGWIHSAHMKFSYSGLYPVFEVSADFGDRNRYEYSLQSTAYSRAKTLTLYQKVTDKPYLSGTARIYVPMDLSSGGWFRGLVPQVNLNFSNDVLNTTEVQTKYILKHGEKSRGKLSFLGTEPGICAPMGRVTAGIRGYAMLPTASSGIYPRWGIGIEAGASRRPFDNGLFTPDVYSFLYGYVPGIMDTHGIKITVMRQRQMEGKIPESYLNTLPRGIASDSSVQSYLSKRFPVQHKFTLDYAMPVLPVDWAGLGPVAYVRNFELTGHLDMGYYCRKSGGDSTMYSAGADLAVRLANLLWIPYDTRIGVSYSWSGGGLWETMAKDNVSPGNHHISLLFSVDL